MTTKTTVHLVDDVTGEVVATTTVQLGNERDEREMKGWVLRRRTAYRKSTGRRLALRYVDAA